jgi:hypothetical protein
MELETFRPAGSVKNDTLSAANLPQTINKIRQILGGHFEGKSSNKLSKMTGSSRTTIKSYLRRFLETGMLFGEANQLSDEDLAQLILGLTSLLSHIDKLEVLLPC